MISCILLSAGLSSRFGSPKALAVLHGRTILEHLLDKTLFSPISEIIVVLGANSQEIMPHILKHEKIKVVHNKDYYLGQTSSFKCGLLHTAYQTQGIMLLPVDYPAVKTDTLTALCNYFTKHRPAILIPTYLDHKGHPPIFHINLKEDFLSLDNAEGINTIAKHNPEEITVLPVEDPGVLKTFSTREEFEELKHEGLL